MRFLVGFCIIVIAIQFIRPTRNAAAAPQPGDIAVKYSAPDSVKQELQAACYDCHSNTTRYPWYANVQPVGWYLAKHIHDGKRHINFSEFAAYPPKRAASKLGHAIDEVRDHGMPLGSYLLLHPEARLTTAQTKELADWLESVRKTFPAEVR